MGGKYFDYLMRRTAGFGFVNGYLNGTVSRDEYREEIDSREDELSAAGLSDWDRFMLHRLPADGAAAVAGLHDMFPRFAEDLEEEFNEYRLLIERRFRHLPDRFTSIFPEETRAAYELSRIIRPKRVLVAGSYYGFLAVWLIPGLAKGGGMTCVDPDPAVCDLASSNMNALGYSSKVDIVCDDAVEVLREKTGAIDLLVVDAYGSISHPNPRYRGKTVYGPILEAALPRMNRGACVLAHNADGDSYDLEEFFRHLSGASKYAFLDTTEHMAVYQL